MPCHGSVKPPSAGAPKPSGQDIIGVEGLVWWSSSSVSEEDSVVLAPIAASFGEEIAIDGGKSPLAINAATCWGS